MKSIEDQLDRQKMNNTINAHIPLIYTLKKYFF